MSSSLATTLALLLYVAALAPALVMLARPRLVGPLAAGLGIAVVGLGIWQTGALQPGLTGVPRIAMSAPTANDGRCRQIVDLLVEGGIVQRSAPGGEFTVREERLSQLPKEAQDVARNCLKGAPPTSPIAGQS